MEFIQRPNKPSNKRPACISFLLFSKAWTFSFVFRSFYLKTCLRLTPNRISIGRIHTYLYSILRWETRASSGAPTSRRAHLSSLPQTQIVRLRLLCRARASALRVIRAFTDKLDKVSAVPDRMSHVLFTAPCDASCTVHSPTRPQSEKTGE